MKGIGRIQDVKTSQQRIIASGEHAKLELVRYSDNVTYYSPTASRTASVFKAQPLRCNSIRRYAWYTILEAQGNHYQISGMKFRVEMEVDNGRLTFLHA